MIDFGKKNEILSATRLKDPKNVFTSAIQFCGATITQRLILAEVYIGSLRRAFD
jgi:hypothetical protein